MGEEISKKGGKKRERRDENEGKGRYKERKELFKKGFMGNLK